MLPNVQPKDILGQGTFGKAVLIKYNGDRYVVKESRFKNDAFKKVFLNEANILNMLSKSPAASYVPDFQGFELHDGEHKGWIFMKYIYGTTLDKVIDLISQARLNPTPEEYAILEEGPLKALNMIHSQHILHLDIKPANMFVELERGTNKIRNVSFIDFGLSIIAGHDYTQAGTPGGTPGFMTPKIEKAFKTGQRVKYDRFNNMYALNKSMENIRHFAKTRKRRDEFIGILNDPNPRTPSPIMAPLGVTPPILAVRPMNRSPSPVMPPSPPIPARRLLPPMPMGQGKVRMVKGMRMVQGRNGLWHPL